MEKNALKDQEKITIENVLEDNTGMNNLVSILGRINSRFRYSHHSYGEGFYIAELLSKRLSDHEDQIQIMISERLIDVSQDLTGEYIVVQGQFRSYNRHQDRKNRLLLSVFVREIRFAEKEETESSLNEIFLEGYICKPTIFRKTPFGREITDLMLAVNRLYGKSDYIPCICWGNNAKYVATLKVGEHVTVWGRIQSREYIKKHADNQIEHRIAYEVSAGRLELVE